jgi:hypothetical protein
MINIIAAARRVFKIGFLRLYSRIKSYDRELLRQRCYTGLPGGIFSNQKSRFSSILEGLALEGVGILYVYLV